MYIFVFIHIVNQYHTNSDVFFLKISMVTNVILVLYNSLINNKLISGNLCFRHQIGCFCSISPTKITPNTVTALFCVSEEHGGVSFLNESIVYDSVKSQ